MRYAVNWDQFLNGSDVLDTVEMFGNVSWPTEYCNDGWIYNKTHVTSSIVIDVRHINICMREKARQNKYAELQFVCACMSSKYSSI